MADNRTFDIARQKGSRQARGWARARKIQPQAADLIDRLRERARVRVEKEREQPRIIVRKKQTGEAFALLMAEEKQESNAIDKRHSERVTKARRDGLVNHRDEGAASTLLDARITER